MFIKHFQPNKNNMKEDIIWYICSRVTFTHTHYLFTELHVLDACIHFHISFGYTDIALIS
jgi:hypothetical protein